MTRTKSLVITGKILRAYFDGRGAGKGELVITDCRADGKRVPDLSVNFEDARPEYVARLPGEPIEINGTRVFLAVRDVQVAEFGAGGTIRFIPF
jgi:hypothetical protein